MSQNLTSDNRLLEANDEWQLQHRYMRTEAMAELTVGADRVGCSGPPAAGCVGQWQRAGCGLACGQIWGDRVTGQLVRDAPALLPERE
jgi:hypothetical protein